MYSAPGNFSMRNDLWRRRVNTALCDRYSCVPRAYGLRTQLTRGFAFEGSAAAGVWGRLVQGRVLLFFNPCARQFGLPSSIPRSPQRAPRCVRFRPPPNPSCYGYRPSERENFLGFSVENFLVALSNLIRNFVRKPWIRARFPLKIRCFAPEAAFVSALSNR